MVRLWLTLLVAAISQGLEAVADQVVQVLEAAAATAIQEARRDVDVAWVRDTGAWREEERGFRV